MKINLKMIFKKNLFFFKKNGYILSRNNKVKQKIMYT